MDVTNAEEVLLTDDLKRDMIAQLNGNLNILNAPIRINDVDIVNNINFSAYRNVLNRSYMYRIAVKIRDESKDEVMIPIEEVSRCFIIEYVELTLFMKNYASILSNNLSRSEISLVF